MAEFSALIETVAAVVPVMILAEIKNVVIVFTFCFDAVPCVLDYKIMELVMWYIGFNQLGDNLVRWYHWTVKVVYRNRGKTLGIGI
ncbi:Protein of unknown function [Gryllus bimaculatus]|nr:Protein of unknown function [Gryllus bimaculatus]